MKNIILWLLVLSSTLSFAESLQDEVKRYRFHLKQNNILLVKYAEGILNYFEQRERFYGNHEFDVNYRMRNLDKIQKAVNQVEGRIRTIAPEVNACLANVNCDGLHFAGDLDGLYQLMKTVDSLVYFPDIGKNLESLSNKILFFTYQSNLTETAEALSKARADIVKYFNVAVPQIPALPIQKKEEVKLPTPRPVVRTELPLCPKGLARGHGTLTINGKTCRQRPPLVLNKREDTIRKRQQVMLNELKTTTIEAKRTTDFNKLIEDIELGNVQDATGTADTKADADTEKVWKVSENESDASGEIEGSNQVEVEATEVQKKLMEWLKKPEEPLKFKPRPLPELIKAAHEYIKMSESDLHQKLKWTDFMMEVAAYDSAANPKMYNDAKIEWDKNKARYDKLVVDNILNDKEIADILRKEIKLTDIKDPEKKIRDYIELKKKEIPELLKAEVAKDYFQSPDSNLRNLLVTMTTKAYSDITKAQIYMNFVGRAAAFFPKDSYVGIQETGFYQARAVIYDKAKKQVMDLSSNEKFESVQSDIYSTKLALHFFLEQMDAKNYKGKKEDYLLAKGPKRLTKAEIEDLKSNWLGKILNKIKRFFAKLWAILGGAKEIVKIIGRAIRYIDWSQIKDVFGMLGKLDADEIKALIDSGRMSDLLDMAKQGKINLKDLPDNMRQQFLLEAQKKYGLTDEELKKVDIKKLVKKRPIKYLPLSEKRKELETLLERKSDTEARPFNKTDLRRFLKIKNEAARNEAMIQEILAQFRKNVENIVKNDLKDQDEFDATYSGELAFKIFEAHYHSIQQCRYLRKYTTMFDARYSFKKLKKDDDDWFRDASLLADPDDDLKYLIDEDYEDEFKQIIKKSIGVQKYCTKMVKESSEMGRVASIMDFWADKMTENPKAVAVYSEHVAALKAANPNYPDKFNLLLRLIGEHGILPCDKDIPMNYKETYCQTNSVSLKRPRSVYKNAWQTFVDFLGTEKDVIVADAASLYIEEVQGVSGEDAARDRIEGQVKFKELQRGAPETVKIAEQEERKVPEVGTYIQVKLDKTFFKDEMEGDEKSQAAQDEILAQEAARKRIEHVKAQKRKGVFIPKDSIRMSRNNFRNLIFYLNDSLDRTGQVAMDETYSTYFKDTEEFEVLRGPLEKLSKKALEAEAVRPKN